MSKAITLNDHYSIESDKYQWILKYEKEYKDESGKNVVSRHATYHGTIKQAIMKFVDNCCKECKELEEIINKLDQIKTLVSTLKL